MTIILARNRKRLLRGAAIGATWKLRCDSGARGRRPSLEKHHECVGRETGGVEDRGQRSSVDAVMGRHDHLGERVILRMTM